MAAQMKLKSSRGLSFEQKEVMYRDSVYAHKRVSCPPFSVSPLNCYKCMSRTVSQIVLGCPTRLVLGARAEEVCKLFWDIPGQSVAILDISPSLM